MARRNLFQPPPPPSDTPAPQKPRFPETGAMSGVRSTLKDLSSNAVRDIPPELIDDGGPNDRLSFGDADVAALAQSIQAHGQQVPIMVRPLPDQPGRFTVVYGRRRLRALRSLGLNAKALVRSLSDEQAILAQGHENSQRLDPSFIEKALFIRELSDGGYDSEIVMDALAVDKPMLSRMNKVARLIPPEVIQIVGPAHGIGRRRWEDMADAIRDRDIDLLALAGEMDLRSVPSSDARFDMLASAVIGRNKAATAAIAPLPVAHADGTRLGEIRPTARALTIKLSRADAPDFAQWLQDNAEAELLRIYETWKSRNG
ncbi:plasmid partitioning protein [Salipiger aestuarii]|uniref:plasmid partitioning protein RepB n=1 Tax=Salipiger aestuarii TaxID=568098 RepID=UPI00025B6446|nr:plasmid partitioning protein RepB [Salipiger aestuarii]EIE51315.1 plasmid partitioning protein RepB [Citreicella sp. 357]KAA8607843.1 plasmid partitioning protein [Salipiger aestuarii]